MGSYLAWNLTTCSARERVGVGEGVATSAIDGLNPENKRVDVRSTKTKLFLMIKGYFPV